MPIAGAYIPVERGTLTFPWGTNRMVVQVESSAPNDEVTKLTFMGPGKQGYHMNVTTRPIKSVVIRGKYTASDVVSQFSMAGLRGSADIQFGIGERWSGSVMTIKSSGGFNYNDLSGSIEMTLEYYGAVPVTPNAAGNSGI